jgi:hypothetical protein
MTGDHAPLQRAAAAADSAGSADRWTRQRHAGSAWARLGPPPRQGTSTPTTSS